MSYGLSYAEQNRRGGWDTTKVVAFNGDGHFLDAADFAYAANSAQMFAPGFDWNSLFPDDPSITGHLFGAGGLFGPRGTSSSAASATNVVGDIYGHSVFVVAQHGSIRIYPDNPGAIDQALLANGFPVTQTDTNGRRYVVFSGGPNYASGTDSFLGNLAGNINNRPSDLASSPNTVIGIISAPSGISRDQFTLTLIANTTNYNRGNQVDYDLLPPIQNGSNSNSYFTGLASSGGGTINTSLSWRFIGAGNPLPPSAFSPNPNPPSPGGP